MEASASISSNQVSTFENLLIQDVTTNLFPYQSLTTTFPDGWILNNSQTYIEGNKTFVALVDKNNNQTLAFAAVTRAENSFFQLVTNLKEEALTNSIFISSLWINPQFQNEQSLSAMLYLTLRKGRIWGRQSIVALVPNITHPTTHIARLEKLDNIQITDPNYTHLIPTAQTLDYALFYSYENCNKHTQAFLNINLISEITQTMEVWLEELFQMEWVRAIYEGTMTKKQYLALLYGTHQYVRYTTRLLGRCVALSNDNNLRDHYIEHLRGEINHERIIERDIKYLGGDVDFVKSFRVPTGGAKEFMVVQESTIAFYQDTILFLACPLAAEGITAFIKPTFIDALHRVIASWGVSEPKEASRFITSHTNTDGGEDGHWVHVVQILEKNITSEIYLQQFLSILRAAMKGLENHLNSNISGYRLWSSSNLISRGNTHGHSDLSKNTTK